MTFHRYVALGDSFTEGVGDPDRDRPNGVRGWADRVAEVLSRHADDFTYANLAIRGRKLRQVIAEQVEPAVALDPDLITMYAGANDVLRPQVDIDGLIAYDAGISRLAAPARDWSSSPHTTPAVPTRRASSARCAAGSRSTTNFREVADHYGATLVDFWRMRELDDPRLWAGTGFICPLPGTSRSRSPCSTRWVSPTSWCLPNSTRCRTVRPRAASSRLAWAKAYLGPWVRRRLTGTSSGDDLSPRRPVPAPVRT